jgi:hypothetical protein
MAPKPEEFRSDLMDQCSRHATPPAVDLLTNQQAHPLAIELEGSGEVSAALLAARRSACPKAEPT